MSPSLWPSLSIIIPSFNQGQFIERTLLSILRQDYPGEVQVIVADGGSKDETVSILEKYPQITWWSRSDKGFVDAVNQGLTAATGEIIAIQSSDDFYLVNAFRQAITFLMEHEEYGFVTGVDFYMKANGKFYINDRFPVEFSDPRAIVIDSIIPAQHCTFVRKIVIDAVGGLCPEIDRCADIDLWYRILHFYKGYRLPVYLGVHQYHPNQRTKELAGLLVEHMQRMVVSCQGDVLYRGRFTLDDSECKDMLKRIEIMLYAKIGTDTEKSIAMGLARTVLENSSKHAPWLVAFAMKMLNHPDVATGWKLSNKLANVAKKIRLAWYRYQDVVHWYYH